MYTCKFSMYAIWACGQKHFRIPIRSIFVLMLIEAAEPADGNSRNRRVFHGVW